MVGSSAIIPSAISDWKPWVSMVNSGFLDVGNHSYSHPNPNLTAIPAGELDHQINGAKALIESNIPGFKVLWFVAPQSVYTQQILDIIKQQHYAFTTAVPGYNSFSATREALYSIKRIEAGSSTTLAEMNRWVDIAIARGEWLNEVMHGCDGEGWAPVPCTLAAQHFAYIASKKNEIWSTGLTALVKYICQRMSAKVSADTSQSSAIKINLTDTMDNAVFNQPLTLKTEIAGDWKQVRIEQTSVLIYSAVTLSDGKNYVFYDAVPDKGIITLSKVTSVGLKNRPQFRTGSGSYASQEYKIYDIKGRLLGTRGKPLSTQYTGTLLLPVQSRKTRIDLISIPGKTGI